MLTSLLQTFCCHLQSGETPLLIATDVAARGLDIDDVEVVINYSFPLVRWRLLAERLTDRLHRWLDSRSHVDAVAAGRW